MKVLMFAGAGSVGKTSLMDACKKMAEERGLTVEMHYSSTRQSYANAGLTSESEALKDPEFNRRFQESVMKDNIANLIDKVTKADGVDLFITDRAPYDYSSYQFTVFQQALTLALIEEKRKLCDDAMVSLTSNTVQIDVVLLPYPTIWAKDTESSDGWRSDKTGKNFIWSSVIEAELKDAQMRMYERCLDTLIRFDRLPSFAERGSVETRAVASLMKVFPHLR